MSDWKPKAADRVTLVDLRKGLVAAGYVATVKHDKSIIVTLDTGRSYGPIKPPYNFVKPA